jgi:hypothetical protein
MPFENLIQKIRANTHKKRSRTFYTFLEHYDRKPIRLIDLGGTASFWQRWSIPDDGSLLITLINNHHIDKEAIGYDNSLPFIKEINGDVTTLTASDYSAYDVIFSNSMIEHLDSFEKQKLLCQNIENSGLPYFIQVPNKKSIIDPHFPHPLVPFFAMYPKNVQARLLTIYGFNGGRSKSHAESINRMKYYNPISKKMFEELLPSGLLVTESFLGVSQSLIKIRS